jgi:hypothetical protein
MLSSRFAGIPISSSTIDGPDGPGVPQLPNRGSNAESRDRLRWPASFRNGGRNQIGTVADIKSESPAGLRRNSQTGRFYKRVFPDGDGSNDAILRRGVSVLDAA